MSLSTQGKLKLIQPTQQIKETFRKREFVLTDDSSNYPQHISFQLIQDNCDLIDAFQVGEEVKVLFNLRGREWTSPSGEIKYFNSLDAWRIERVASQQPAAPAPQAAAPAQTSSDMPPLPSSDKDLDDLPF